MEENTVGRKVRYKCGICGKSHFSVYDRMNCEMSCVKKQQEEERKAAEEKKAAEQKMRKDAVDEAIKRAAKLQNDYVKDYGSYEYKGELIDNIFLPSKLWHHFVF